MVFLLWPLAPGHAAHIMALVCLSFPLGQCLNRGDSVPNPGDTWQCQETFKVVLLAWQWRGGRATGIREVESSDAVYHPAEHGTAPTENNLAPVARLRNLDKRLPTS